MSINLPLIIGCLLAYLLGSLSSAVIVCRLLGLKDPRQNGSRNPGTTNVLRIGGKKAAGLTLAGDLLKGFIPVWVASYFKLNPFELSLIGGFAFLGHLYPLFFRFQGGKGVATLFGVSLALNLSLGFALILTWLFVALFTRYSSLAALLMALCAPFYTLYGLGRLPALVILTMAALLIRRHQQNIKNLWAGTERKIGQKT